MKILALLLFVFISTNLSASKEISLSFDDAPRGDSRYFTGVKRTKHIISSLREAKVGQVIFYANSAKISNASKLSRLKSYQKAGHLIGNHTATHMSADRNTAQDFIHDLEAADLFLKKHNLLSHYFRFPYLRRGGTLQKIRVIRKRLLELGYRDGYVTIDNYDWYMDSLFQTSLKNQKIVNMKKLRDFYVETLMKSVRFFNKVAVDSFDKSPKHVLLLHENDLAALYIKDLVVALRNEGWTIISPKDSYDEPLLNKYPDIIKHGQGRVVSKLLEKGYVGKIRSSYEDEDKLDELYDQYQVERN